jgi:hypothetical protein
MITNALTNGRYNYIFGYHVKSLYNTSSKFIIDKLNLFTQNFDMAENQCLHFETPVASILKLLSLLFLTNEIR